MMLAGCQAQGAAPSLLAPHPEASGPGTVLQAPAAYRGVLPAQLRALVEFNIENPGWEPEEVQEQEWRPWD
jgi:hypothetical protein